jgi:hypothetical protein
MAAGMLKDDIPIRVAVTVTTSRPPPTPVEPPSLELPLLAPESDEPPSAATPRTATKAASTQTITLERPADKDILATTSTPLETTHHRENADRPIGAARF